MGLEKDIFDLMKRKDYVPMSVDTIIMALKLPKNKWKKLKRLIQLNSNSGKIVRVKQDRYCLPTDADLVTGQLKFRQNGSAILFPEKKLDHYSVDVFEINAEDTGVSIHGDRVVARILRNTKATPRFRKGKKLPPRKEDEGKVYARVLRIIDRKFDSIPGTLKRTKMFYYVIPDDPRFTKDILVLPPNKNSDIPFAQLDDKVIVKIISWEQKHLNPEGEIVKVLGPTHTPFAEYQAILHKHDLNPDFPADVMNEVEGIPDKVPEQAITARHDCRKLFTFTIDPDDAKDFDDALSIEYLPDNKTRIGIHIADVSHYVKPGTELDKEAKNRGNSTYLVGTVIPMLPHKLSNGVCSLVEDEDRLTKAVFATFDSNNNLEEINFANTAIRSNKRLTYKQALAFLELDDFAQIQETPLPPNYQTGSIGKSLKELSKKEMVELQTAIRKSWEIAEKMRRKRMRTGSLDFDMPEVKIYLDKDGYADRIVKLENDISHQLIEEFMLLANEEIAREMTRCSFGCIYRVHDKPDSDKLDELREYLITFGVETGNLDRRKEVLKMLNKLQDHPQGFVLKIQFLRSLKQACYRSSPDGHYGLNKTNYTHFTSPIRRYSDLIVHRVLNYYMAKMGGEPQPEILKQPYKASELRSLGEHLSITEQNSSEAERESNKVKQLEFFDREITREDKTVFKAIITDLKNHGLFVELTDLTTFGFIHISTFKDDLYSLSPSGTELVGRRTKNKYSLGQIIEVQVSRVDRFKRQIDFKVI